MRLAATALVFAAATLGTSAIAQDQSAPAVAEQNDDKAEKKKKVKKICKNISDMGSRRTKRKCLTREQWVEFNRGE